MALPAAPKPSSIIAQVPGSGTAPFAAPGNEAVVEAKIRSPDLKPVPRGKSLNMTLIALVVMLSPEIICSLRMIVTPSKVNDVLGAAPADAAPVTAARNSAPNTEVKAEPESMRSTMLEVPVRPSALAVDVDVIVVAVIPKRLLIKGSVVVSPIPALRPRIVAVAMASVALVVDMELNTRALSCSDVPKMPGVSSTVVLRSAPTAEAESVQLVPLQLVCAIGPTVTVASATPGTVTV